jgi:DNA-binding LacI/PurR family transcriptional regulator
MTIALIAPLTGQWFYTKVATTIEAILMEAGYDVIRYSIESLEQESHVFEKIIRRRRVDGIIFLTVEIDSGSIDFLSTADLAVVTIETETGLFPAVTCNNYEAARTATQYLCNIGHRDIGIISGLPNDPLHFGPPGERKKGYLDVLKEQNIPLRTELEVPGNFSLAGGAEAMAKLFSVNKPPTAVFCFSDEMAIGALKTIQDLGLKVPQDISIMGFDDHDVSEYLHLTTIRQPIEDFGEKAASYILTLLDEDTEKIPMKTILDTQLVIRATTGAPPKQ